MDHATTRAILVPEIVKLISEKYQIQIVKLISEKYQIPEMEALDLFYTSATGASFADDETGLYGQSALYIFGLFVEEKEHLNSM